MCFRDKAASAGASLTGATRRVEPSSVGMLATPPLPAPRGGRSEPRPRCAGLIIRPFVPLRHRLASKLAISPRGILENCQRSSDSTRLNRIESFRRLFGRVSRFKSRPDNFESKFLFASLLYYPSIASPFPSLQFESITRKPVISTRDTNGRSWVKNAFTRFLFRFSLFRVCRVESGGLDRRYRSMSAKVIWQ